MTTHQAPGPDQAAVAAIPQQLLTAWVDQDGDRIADLFVDDGTLILPNVYRQGREDIRVFFKDAFDNDYRGTQVVGTPLGLRFLGPDVALLLTAGGVLAAGETEVSEAQAIRASWLAVRVDGEWKLAQYQNTPAKRGLPTPGA